MMIVLVTREGGRLYLLCTARLFPNEASCLRLVSAVLMDISEDWQTVERRYVVFTDEQTIEG